MLNSRSYKIVLGSAWQTLKRPSVNQYLSGCGHVNQTWMVKGQQQNEQKLTLPSGVKWHLSPRLALTHVHCEVNPSAEACHMTEKTTGWERPEWGLQFYKTQFLHKFKSNSVIWYLKVCTVIKDKNTRIFFGWAVTTSKDHVIILQDFWITSMTALKEPKCSLMCCSWVHAIWYMKASVTWVIAGYRMCWCVLSWRRLWLEHIDVDWFSTAMGRLRLAHLHFATIAMPM